jgi:HAD superfamily hydrolase (TIGR01509 family)
MLQNPLIRRTSAVVFDMDGVLLDSAPSHSEAFQEVFRPLGIYDFDYRRYAGWKTAEVIETVLKCAGHETAPGRVAELAAEKSRLAREKIVENNPVDPDCITLLRSLSKEYLLGLASSGSRASIAAFLSSTGCAPVFKSVLCGDDVSRAKPHPEIYLRTFTELGVAPDAAMVVEDAVAGIEAARAAGAGTVIGVEGTCSAARLTEAGADRIVFRVSELSEFLCNAN